MHMRSRQDAGRMGRSWEDLCDAIHLPRTRASDMLGAAERRCKGYPPYEKYEGQRRLLVPDAAEVAAYIREAAGEMVI